MPIIPVLYLTTISSPSATPNLFLLIISPTYPHLTPTHDHLYVADVGDSRVVISKAGKTTLLSEDHKPNRNDERKGIENPEVVCCGKTRDLGSRG